MGNAVLTAVFLEKLLAMQAQVILLTQEHKANFSWCAPCLSLLKVSGFLDCAVAMVRDALQTSSHLLSGRWLHFTVYSMKSALLTSDSGASRGL